MDDANQPLLREGSTRSPAPMPTPAAPPCQPRVMSLWFGWVSPLLKTGAARQLQADDLLPLDDKMDPVACTREIWTGWTKARAAHSARPSLLRVLWDVHGTLYVKLGVLKLLDDLLTFSGPLVLKLFILWLSSVPPTYVPDVPLTPSMAHPAPPHAPAPPSLPLPPLPKPGHAVLLGQGVVEYSVSSSAASLLLPPWWGDTSGVGYGVLLVLLLGASSLAQALLSNCYSWHMNRLICRLRAGLMGALYVKSLVLRPTGGTDVPPTDTTSQLPLTAQRDATADKSQGAEVASSDPTTVAGAFREKSEASSGAMAEAQTLMSVDVSRVAGLGYCGHDLWSLPLQIALALYLLYSQVRYAFLAGLAVCLLLIPVNKLIATAIEAAQTRMMTHKDERVRLIGEWLRGARAVKMLAWENVFAQQISLARGEELKALGTLKYLDALCVYFWAATSLIFSVLTFGLVVLLGGRSALTADIAFTSMALFQVLIQPLNMFPWVINGVLAATVSLKRLTSFLAAPASSSHWAASPLNCNPAASSPGGADVQHPIAVTRSGDNGDSGDTGDSSDGDIRDHEDGDSGDTGDSSDHDGGDGEGGDHDALSKPLLSRGDQHDAVQLENPSSKSDGVGAIDIGSMGVGGTSQAGVVGTSVAEDGGSPAAVATLCGATFRWSKTVKPCLSDLSLSIPSGQLTVLVGQVGGGKSSLLAALMGELPPAEGSCQLHVAGTIGYVSQQPWVLSGTLRDNILLGQALQPELYRQVLHATALLPDLARLPAGDATPAGEHGSALSGGQRVRVALARALYQRCEMLLLDDVLAALDNTCAAHVLQHALLGSLTAGRTCVIVTNSARCIEAAQLVVQLEHGHLAFVGSPEAYFSRLLSHGVNVRGGGPPASGLVGRGSSLIGGGETGGTCGTTATSAPARVDAAEAAATQAAQCSSGVNGDDQATPLCVDVDAEERRSCQDMDGGGESCAVQALVIAASGSSRPFGNGDAMPLATAGPGSSLIADAAAEKVSGGVRTAGKAAGRAEQEGERTAEREEEEEELREAGHVQWPVYREYLLAVGVTMVVAVLLSLVLMQMSKNATDLWVTFWVSTRPDSGSGNASSTCTPPALSAWPLLPAPSSSSPYAAVARGGAASFSQLNPGTVLPFAAVPACHNNSKRLISTSPRLSPSASLTGVAAANSTEAERVVQLGRPTTATSRSAARLLMRLAIGQERRSSGSSSATSDGGSGSGSGSVSDADVGRMSLLADMPHGSVNEFTHLTDGNTDGDSVTYFLHGLFAIAALNCVFTLARAFTFAYAGMRAARLMHERLLHSVLQAPMAFFDSVPVGRVVNRFSSDMSQVDDSLPFTLNILLACSAGLAALVAVLCYSSPWVLLALPPLLFLYGRLQVHYRSTAREVRRLDATSLSPVYSSFAEVTEAAPSIRAFRVQPAFTATFLAHVTRYQRASFSGAAISAWLSLRLQLIASSLVTLVGALAVATRQWHLPASGGGGGGAPSDDSAAARAAATAATAAFAGLGLSYALPLVQKLGDLLTWTSETENEMVGVERILQYTTLTPEGSSTVVPAGGSAPPHSFPAAPSTPRQQVVMDVGDGGTWHSGGTWTGQTTGSDASSLTRAPAALEFTQVYMRYSSSRGSGGISRHGGSSVGGREASWALAGLSLRLEAGEKLGICGRTGAGKSSLINCLLRLVDVQSGTVLVGGVDVRSLHVRELRRRFGVVPQVPLLLRGLVRQNLDPFEVHPDSRLVDALRSVRLWEPLMLWVRHHRSRTGAGTDHTSGGAVASLGRQEGPMARLQASPHAVAVIRALDSFSVAVQPPSSDVVQPRDDGSAGNGAASSDGGRRVTGSDAGEGSTRALYGTLYCLDQRDGRPAPSLGAAEAGAHDGGAARSAHTGADDRQYSAGLARRSWQYGRVAASQSLADSVHSSRADESVHGQGGAYLQATAAAGDGGIMGLGSSKRASHSGVALGTQNGGSLATGRSQDAAGAVLEAAAAVALLSEGALSGALEGQLQTVHRVRVHRADTRVADVQVRGGRILSSHKDIDAVPAALSEMGFSNTNSNPSQRQPSNPQTDTSALDTGSVVGASHSAWMHSSSTTEEQHVEAAAVLGLQLGGAQGVSLSAGQQQLLCLARTLLQGRRVVLLDEVTASVDPATSRLMQGVMATHFKGCAVLQVAHDLTGIAEYDRVAVLECGSAVETGRPAELMARTGSHFAQLVAQAARPRADG